MLKFPPPEHQNFTTKMNVSAHGDENATFQFFARIVAIAKEKQWSGDPSHPMRLMRLGGMGAIPRPLLLLRNINDSGEKLKCRIFVPVRGNIHFCCKIPMFWGRNFHHFVNNCDFCPKCYTLCFKMLIRLDICVAFLQIEPEILILAL